MGEYSLSGMKIIDLSHYIAGPYCTKLLCGLGADVIKVERPDGGDPARRLGPFPDDKPDSERSGMFSFLNAGKKGITLNLKTQSGVKIFKELIKDADVLVENFEPRVMQSLGLSYDSLARINPKLVMVSISNFGQYGPYRDYKASEIITEALGGYMYLVGAYDREPVKSGIYLAQYYSGSAGAAAALAATYGADVGQHLDISLMESVAFSLFYPLGSYSYYGAIPRRTPKIDSAELGYGLLPAQDGFVYPLTYGYVDWGALARVVLERPELDNPRFDNFASRTEHIEELKDVMLSIFSDKSAQELFHKAQSVGFPWGFVRRVDEVANCPQLLARGFYQVVSDSAGQEIQWPEQPFSMATPWKAGKPPLLGEHNEEIYCGYLGYSKTELVKLRELNVI
jgi:crotonobetainyl-CoA:carnitine CoA-transferase CaiB-like acyl-CoA transferase